MELETARAVVEAARKNLATLQRSLKALRKREKVAAERLDRLRKRSDRRSGDKLRAELAAARDAVAKIRAARRRNENLISRQEKDITAQRRQLKRLEGHAEKFRRDFATFSGEQPRSGRQRHPVPPPEISGEQLRGARAMLNQSQAEFAEALGLSVATLRKFERMHGEVIDDLETASRIAVELHRLGIELIGRGPYVGSGGPGVRLGPRRASAEGRGDSLKTTARKKRRKRRAASAA